MFIYGHRTAGQPLTEPCRETPMRFTELPLAGAFVIDLEPHADARGFFARAFCIEELAAHGLIPPVAQCNLSLNYRAGTLRGLHFRIGRPQETKLVRCLRGAIHDIIIDLRPTSPTYLRHVGVELTAANRRSLYVPEHFAHGFQTLADDTEVFYHMSGLYTPDGEAGLRFDDPALGITWPR